MKFINKGNLLLWMLGAYLTAFFTWMIWSVIVGREPQGWEVITFFAAIFVMFFISEKWKLS